MITFLVNTSFLIGIICFILAYQHASMPFKSSRIEAGAWLFFGACYFLTQFGGDWFIQNQRIYFRLAVTGIAASRLIAIYHIRKLTNDYS